MYARIILGKYDSNTNYDFKTFRVTEGQSYRNAYNHSIKNRKKNK